VGGGAGASGGAAGAGGGAAGAGGVTVDCPDAGGEMVALPGGFCIDATEVTRASYSAWLASGPQVTQPLECGWNKSFEPLVTCMNHPKDVCQGQCDGHPQVCVDWCDAWSYCRFHGKRLCGRLQGGATPTDAFAHEAEDAWYRACTSGGVNQWTFGNDVGTPPYACNFGHDSDTLPTVASGSMVGCQSPASGYSGVFDMTGNAAEWQDSCAAGAAEQDLCRLRGGSFDRGADSNRCDADRMEARSVASFATGFRCCFP
jgi:formylglycine-generating enzyme required for sulfatase activity